MMHADTRQHPTEQPVADRRRRLGHRHREDEGQQRGGRRRRRPGRHDAGEQHDEARPRAMATTAATLLVDTAVPMRDEHRADHEQGEIRHDPRPHRTGELDQQEQGERAERGEEADLRIREVDVRDGEDRRASRSRPARIASRPGGPGPWRAATARGRLGVAPSASSSVSTSVMASAIISEHPKVGKLCALIDSRHAAGPPSANPAQPFAGSERAKVVPSLTHLASCGFVRTSALSTRSQPGIARPCMTATDALVVATSLSDCSGSTRTKMPP